LYSVLIVTNSQSLFLPLFMMTPNKFYRTGLKFLFLTNGRRCDCSFSPLHFTHPCNDIFFYEYLYCTIYNIVHWRIHIKNRNVCICNVLLLH